ERPSRWIIGEFEIRRGADRRGEMRVGDDAEPVAPSVRRKGKAARSDIPADLGKAGDAADDGGIGLIDVEALTLHKGAILVDFPIELTAGNAQLRRLPQRRHAG